MGCMSSKKQGQIILPSPVNETHQVHSSNPAAVVDPVKDQSSQNIFIITESILNHYEIKQSLGTGKYGTVKLGLSKKTENHKVAIKSVLKERAKEDLKNIQRELTILKTLNHPNIIKLFEVFEDDKYLHIVMEHCAGGELFDRLEKKGKFSEKEAANVMYKLLDAIYHMHSSNISHRDLKPENCLFETKKENSEIKIVDFGLATRFTLDKGMSSVVGTPYYVAPEIINGNYGPECDLWSLGVILYTLLAGYHPFRGDNRNEIFKNVLKGKYSLKEKEFNEVSLEAKELIKKLLNRDAKKRIKAHEALQDPWFTLALSQRMH